MELDSSQRQSSLNCRSVTRSRWPSNLLTSRWACGWVCWCGDCESRGERRQVSMASQARLGSPSETGQGSARVLKTEVGNQIRTTPEGHLSYSKGVSAHRARNELDWRVRLVPECCHHRWPAGKGGGQRPVQTVLRHATKRTDSKVFDGPKPGPHHPPTHAPPNPLWDTLKIKGEGPRTSTS